MARSIHNIRREKKYGKYAVYLNSWYLFAGLYLLGGKYIPRVKEEKFVSTEIAYNRVKNHFSSFIKGNTLIDGILHQDIPSKVFIGAFRFFDSLFIPLVPNLTNSFQEKGFYNKEELELKKLQLMTNHSSEWAERQLVDRFINSTSNPFATTNFFNYMERLKSNYIIFGDSKSKKRYLRIVEYITFKKLKPKFSIRWPTRNIFFQQLYFVNIKNHPVSQEEIEEIFNSLDPNGTEKFQKDAGYFIKNYYPCYYYFFKCLDAIKSKSAREILYQINSELSLKRLFSPVRTELSKTNLRNGKALGCGPDLFIWNEIEEDNIKGS